MVKFEEQTLNIVIAQSFEKKSKFYNILFLKTFNLMLTDCIFFIRLFMKFRRISTHKSSILPQLFFFLLKKKLNYFL